MRLLLSFIFLLLSSPSMAVLGLPGKTLQFERLTGVKLLFATHIISESHLEGVNKLIQLWKHPSFAAKKFDYIMVSDRFIDVDTNGIVKIDFYASEKEISAHFSKQTSDWKNLKPILEKLSNQLKKIDVRCSLISINECIQGANSLQLALASVDLSRKKTGTIYISNGYWDESEFYHEVYIDFKETKQTIVKQLKEIY